MTTQTVIRNPPGRLVEIAKTLLRSRVNQMECCKRAAELVCEFYGVKPSDIEGASRVRPMAWPRQVAHYLAAESGASLNLAGSFFNRDHGTILHSRNRVRDLCDAYPPLAKEIDGLKRRMGATP